MKWYHQLTSNQLKKEKPTFKGCSNRKQQILSSRQRMLCRKNVSICTLYHRCKSACKCIKNTYSAAGQHTELTKIIPSTNNYIIIKSNLSCTFINCNFLARFTEMCNSCTIIWANASPIYQTTDSLITKLGLIMTIFWPGSQFLEEIRKLGWM